MPLSNVSEELAPRLERGGFVHDIERFDNGRFAISAAEAGAMDPQQRLLLERGYAALYAAGRDAELLAGTRTGIHVGIYCMDWAEILHAMPAGRGVFAATGAALSVASGRLSYCLGLQGACVSYETACSASLAATHGAAASLRSQGANDDAALAAGVNLMLLPRISLSYARAGMTSPLGRCHTFDRRADGYVRSEACCAVTLSVHAD